jgi:hypothetical protein
MSHIGVIPESGPLGIASVTANLGWTRSCAPR